MTNILTIPTGHFGTSGIELADFVYQEIKKNDRACDIVYDSDQRRIVIKDLAKMTLKQLGEFFGKISQNRDLPWFPDVDRQTSNGDILVLFVAQIGELSEPPLL